MLDMLEKLINEHGSSTILRERLELFSDKYSILEEKLESANQKNSALEAENQSLKTQLQQTTQDVARLQDMIDSATESQSGDKLDEVKERILKIFFETNSDFTIAHLSQSLGIEESLVQYHIDTLKESELVAYGPLRINSPTTFKISTQGRKVVVEQIGI